MTMGRRLLFSTQKKTQSGARNPLKVTSKVLILKYWERHSQVPNIYSNIKVASQIWITGIFTDISMYPCAHPKLQSGAESLVKVMTRYYIEVRWTNTA